MKLAVIPAVFISISTFDANAEMLEVEKDELTFGFIKLTDMAPLAIAYEKGYFEDEGLFVTLEPQANWKVLLDGVITGELDGAHMLAGQPLAATVVIENTQIMFSYSGFSQSGAVLPVMPLINSNNSGYVTGMDIQNAGDTTTTITVSYTPSQDGTPCTETNTIAAGESKTFALFPFAGYTPPGGSTTCINERFIGSARVTSNSANQPLVANIKSFVVERAP